MGLSASRLTMARSRCEPFLGRIDSVRTAGVAEEILNTWNGLRSAGRSGRILSSALLTSVAAESRPFWYSNSALTTETSSFEVEVTRRTRSMVFTSFSMTRLTSAETSSAEAPRQTVTTAICGRSLSGKRFTGMRK